MNIKASAQEVSDFSNPDLLDRPVRAARPIHERLEWGGRIAFVHAVEHARSTTPSHNYCEGRDEHRLPEQRTWAKVYDSPSRGDEHDNACGRGAERCERERNAETARTGAR